VKSPCNRVCVMDGDNRYCIGCLRTLGEISSWGSMSDEEQAAVLRKIEQRRAESPELQAARNST
jgi:uncharacterized protein